MKRRDIKKIITEGISSIDEHLSKDQALEKLTDALSKLNIPGLGLDVNIALYRALAKSILKDLADEGIYLSNDTALQEKIDPTQKAFDSAMKKSGADIGPGKGNTMGFSIERLKGYDKLPETYDEESNMISIIVPSVDGIGYEMLRSKQRAQDWVKKFQDKFGTIPKFEKTDAVHPKVINNPKFSKYTDNNNDAIKGDYGPGKWTGD